MTQSVHSRQALHLLQMLSQSDAVCALLSKGLEDSLGSGTGPDSNMLTANEGGASARQNSEHGLEPQGRSEKDAAHSDGQEPPSR